MTKCSKAILTSINPKFSNRSFPLSWSKRISSVENPDSCLIFCNTKQKADEVYTELVKKDGKNKKIPT